MHTDDDSQSNHDDGGPNADAEVPGAKRPGDIITEQPGNKRVNTEAESPFEMTVDRRVNSALYAGTYELNFLLCDA